MPSTTFDFTSGVTADNDPNIGTPTRLASQTIGSNTLTLALDLASTANAVVMDEQDFFGGDISNLAGNAFETTFDAFSNSLTLSLDSGKSFDLTSINIIDETAGIATFFFTTSKGTVQVLVDSSSSNAVIVPFNDAKLQGVTSVVITQQGAGPNMLIGLDDIKLDNILAANAAPVFVNPNNPLVVAQNGASAAGALATLLHVSDTDSGQTETWSQSVAPSHGTLGLTGTTAASGGVDIAPGGSLSYTAAAGFAGVDTFTVNVSDGSANTTRQITVNVGPATPGAPDLASGSDSGSSATDNITSAGTLNFSGTSAVGDSASTVRVFLDKNNNSVYDAGTDATATATVSNGAWTVNGLSTTGLADGSYNVYAQVTSADGNLKSAVGSGLAVQIDKTAPTQTVSGLALSADTGDSASDFITKTAAQTVTGTLSAALGASDTLYGSLDNGATWVDITSKVSGTAITWTGVTLSGSDTVKLKVSDAAGNSGAVLSQAYVLDSLAPSAPSTPDLASASDGGASSSDNLTDDTTPTFTGTAAANATVKLYDTDGVTVLGADTADGSGNWQITASMLSGGAHTVSAKASDTAGNVSAASSGLTVIIHTANTAPAGGVAIGGAATQGQTLTASNTLADADGLGTISYQWKSDGADISGATASTFALTQASVGHVISVAASYTDGFGAAETVTSADTSSVANLNDGPTGAVSIAGVATQGQVLTASNTLADLDGLGTITYQWKSNGANIVGATSATLTLGQAQVGQTVTVVASYTDGSSHAESVASSATGAVANIDDAPTGAPALSGDTMEGAVLTTSTAAIVDLDGLGVFSYVWRADGAVIGGAAAATFTLTSDQIGKAITVTVSYTDGFGHGESVTSTATTPIQPQPAPDPDPPVVVIPTLPTVIAAAGDAVGVDTTAPKATSPTVVLADGKTVANPVFAMLEQAKAISAQLSAGIITTLQAKELLIDLATPTQFVAHETYNFFTGAPPTAAGFTYLIDSSTNPTDLTDAYYAGFNEINRYINFAVNLGAVGEGKANFQAGYGELTFEQAVSKAYDAVIGDQVARAAGFDPVAGKAYVVSQLPYFMALGGGELGAKAAMVGYLLSVGAEQHLGAYYQAAHDFVAPQIQLVGSSGSLVAEVV